MVRTMNLEKIPKKMTIPFNYLKAKVIFESGNWIEAGKITIDFDNREVILEEIGRFKVTSSSEKKILEEEDGLAFLPEIESCRVFCVDGEVIIPFPKKRR